MGNTERKSFFKDLMAQKEIGAVIPLAIMIIAVGIVNPNFFGIYNLMDVMRTAAFSLIVAVPVTFLTSAGGLDLSIGATTSMGGVVCGTALKAGVPLPFAIILALLVGLIIGLFNSTCIVRFKLPGFIVTLGTQYCINGIINVWTSGYSITNLPKSYTILGQYRVFKYVPMPIIYALILAIIGHIILQNTKFGRKVLAVGGNPETAFLAGINVVQTQMIAYCTVSVIAALAGVIYGARFATVQPAIGSGTEMTIIAAVTVGGTSMRGGMGTIVGTAIGCMLLAMITNVLILMGVSSYWQSFIFGLILIISLFIDKYRQKILNLS